MDIIKFEKANNPVKTDLWTCSECFAVVLGRDMNQHAEWHARANLSPTERALVDAMSGSKGRGGGGGHGPASTVAYGHGGE